MALFTEFLEADLQKPYISQESIFAGVQLQQQHLDAQEFATIEAAETAVYAYITPANQLLGQLGLHGVSVRIYSPDLVLGRVVRNLETGIRTNVPERVTPPLTVEAPSTIGRFYGLTERITAEPGVDGYLTNIRPQLCYKALFPGQSDLPTMSGPLACFAPVSNARLEFMADKQRSDTVRSLKTLAEHNNPGVERLAKQILDISTNTTQLGQASPVIGSRARRYLDKHPDTSEAERSALLDLIQARLGTYDGRFFSITANASFVLEFDVPSGQDKTIAPIADQIFPITALTYTPRLIRGQMPGSQPTLPHAPAITIADNPYEDAKPNIYQIPLERVSALKPLA